MIALLLPLLALQSAPAAATAIDAERAMEAAAQTEGQWTAVRRFAAPDALVLDAAPHGVEGLPAEDPAVAYHWQVSASFVSCDGSMAVNTGPWQRPGRTGYFTTVWTRQSDGQYRWSLDSGNWLPTPRMAPVEPVVRRASCKGKPRAPRLLPTPGAQHGYGQSADGTLGYYWAVKGDGTIVLVVNLWDGDDWLPEVLRDEIEPPK